ncbi:hypothetical protein PanWU01x14_041060 [Parasponia andersonii]|uniref:Uncharacterized protein n=1 Tax=Parasponia andersonii TaxID=3476 RepID=A0A2P5DQD0_PARAD|nr:hypothetical protein PanWU01x14_041060 [Parasponia andersonii]
MARVRETMAGNLGTSVKYGADDDLKSGGAGGAVRRKWASSDLWLGSVISGVVAGKTLGPLIRVDGGGCQQGVFFRSNYKA